MLEFNIARGINCSKDFLRERDTFSIVQNTRFKPVYQVSIEGRFGMKNLAPI